MNSLPGDQNIRDRIIKDIEHNFLVEAGAGTGKTTLMVARLMEIIRSGYSLSGVAAITFTEKAAEELKTRLRKEIQEVLNKKDVPDKKLKYFSQALSDLEAAQVATIHSFASSLLREKPVEAKLDPRFQVLEPLESESFIAEQWKIWMEEQLEQKPDPLVYALQLGFSIKNLHALAAALYRSRDLRCPSPAGAAEKPPAFISRLEDLLNKISSLKQLCKDPEDRGVKEAAKALSSCRRLSAEKGENLLLSLLRQPIKIHGGKLGSKSNWPEESLKDFRAYMGELKDLISQAYSHASDWFTLEVINWLWGFINRLEQEKFLQGVVDFDDLLIKARNMLRENAEVRGYFKQKYHRLLVDEFQDTDPLQAEIVFYLAEAPSAESAKNWQDVRLAPGKLFVVGDPKQSIYRFRRADISVYKKVQNLIRASGGEVLNIQENFRSRSGIINWVNDLFSELLADIGYSPLFAHRTEAAAAPRVIKLKSTADDLKDIEAVRRQEAEIIADNIASILDAPEQWPVEKDGKMRPVKPGDIAVLIPKRTKIHFLEEALRGRKINYVLEGGKTFYQRPEIQSVFAVLQTIVYPFDKIALLAALRSPLLGCTDQEIFSYYKNGGTLDFRISPDENYPGLKNAFSVLAQLYQMRNSAGVGAVVEQMLAETSAVEVFLTEGGERAVGNLDKVVMLARRFDAQKGGTLGSFVDWMGQMWAEMREEAETPSLESLDNAVTITTIHKAKGLEFPLVIMANLNSVVKNSPGFVIADHITGRIEACLNKVTYTASYMLLKENEKKQLQDEIMRLLYVAVTRAREYLIISPFSRSSGTDYLSFLGDLSELPEINVQPVKQAAAVHKDKQNISSEFRKWDQRKNVIKRAVENLPVILSPSGSEHCFAFNADMPEGLPEGTADSQLPAEAKGAEFGTALHDLLQNIPLNPPPDDDEINRIVEQAAPFPGAVEGLRDQLNNYLKSSVFLRAQKALHCWREVPFAVNIGGSYLEGRVDMLLEEADGLVIVDYKSDDLASLSEDMRRQRLDGYQGQGSLYALAISEAVGKQIKDVVFIFTRTGEEWHPGNNIEALQQQARSYLQTAAGSEYNK